MSKIVLKKEAFFYNANLLSSIAKSKNIYAVLKDNAYGHGLDEIARLCAQYGFVRAIVRDFSEAAVVSHMFEEVLCLSETKNFDLTRKNISYAVNSMESLQKMESGTKIHLKIDSGMHRNGISPSELDVALQMTAKKGLSLVGVMSHLRSADELSSELFWQEKIFLGIRQSVLDFCDRYGLNAPMFHLYNSAGLVRQGELGVFDAARVGIALYGLLEMPSGFFLPEFKPVMTLIADRISSRKLFKGARVGYGGAGTVAGDTRVACYDIGYADGLMRVGPRGGLVLADGTKVVGRVSMDSFCADADREFVVLFEDARVLAKQYGTIGYEIVTRLSPAIQRVVL